MTTMAYPLVDERTDLTLYAVCLNTADPARPDDWWIEFHWADDPDEAEHKAESANPGCAVVCVNFVPEFR